MPQDLISQFDRKYALPIETYRQVQNITQRNAIPAPIRWEGMMCYVISEGLSYVLTAGMENSDWVEFGALVDVTVVDNLLSTSSTDALSANQGRVLQITKLSDAPSDGNTYGRLDGAWAVVGGGAVDSVFGRTGDVVAQVGDYSSFYQVLTEKGAANGYTPLDSGAKVPIAYLPDSVIGQVQYQGTWAASTNTPTLANPPSAATKGHYYVASDNGTQFGISFQTGDWIISNGTAWEKVDNTDAVTSVFGRIGAVVANTGDYTFAQIGSKPTTLAGYGITDGVPTSRILTAGNHLSGGGNLTANRTFTLTPSINTWVVDNEANQRMYFADETQATNGIILKNSNNTTSAQLQWRGLDNVVRWNVNLNGNSVQSGTATATNFIGNWNGLSDGQFLRSDATDTKTAGNTIYNDNLQLSFGDSEDMRLFHTAGGNSSIMLTSGNLVIQDGANVRFTFGRPSGNFIATGNITATNFIGNWNGLSDGQFLRSDANDIKTAGYTRYNDQLEVQFGTGNDARLQHDGGQMNLDLTTGGFHIRVGAALERWRLEQNGNTVQFGTATATNFILSSDRRLKKDIEDYTPVHIPIRWREFTWKESGERQIGTIAQETPKQFVTKGADGKLAVKTVEMLMAKVAELEARIINLER